jgi:predicted MFS family arabinose efflux permease
MTNRVYRTVTVVGAAQVISHAGAYYLPAVMAVPASIELSISSATVYAGLSLALAVSGLAGPTAGKLVDRFGGRPVLIASNLLLAAGLSLLALAQGLSLLLLAYAVLGLGMATGMFEVAFAAIVRIFGKKSHNALVGVTMVAGFASVAGWTISVFVEARYGWRGVCWFWAAMNVLVALPLNMLIPRASDSADPAAPAESHNQTAQPSTVVLDPKREKYITVLLAFVFASSGFISMGMMSHLPRLLEGVGVPLLVAFSIGALVGPAQITGRILDFSFLRRLHPLIGTRIAALAHPLGIAALVVLGAPFAALFVILHGLGNGILIIARGTLPLALFGPQGFGRRQGWLTMPAKFAQAIAPFTFGLALTQWGTGVLWLTFGLAMCSFAALCLIAIKPSAEPTREV